MLYALQRWRRPTGSSSIQGPFRAPSTGRSLPSAFRLGGVFLFSPVVGSSSWSRPRYPWLFPFWSTAITCFLFFCAPPVAPLLHCLFLPVPPPPTRSVLFALRQCLCFLFGSAPPPFPQCFLPCITLLPSCTHVSTALVIGSQLPSVLVPCPFALLGPAPWRYPAMPGGRPSLALLSSLPSLLSPPLPPPLPCLSPALVLLLSCSVCSPLVCPAPCPPSCRPTWAASQILFRGDSSVVPTSWPLLHQRGHLDYAHLEDDARHTNDHAEQATAQDLNLWINRLTTEEQLALAVRIRWLLTSRSRHLAEGTRTVAGITFGHQTVHTPPGTMDHPGQWHYVAIPLMAHMGAYSPDKRNGLHWQWHQRAALRIRMAMQRHNVWDIPGSPGYQGHASGHQRTRSQEVPEPPRQAARRNSPERHQGPPPGVGSPFGTYRSPLRPFAPRRGQGSPHTSGVQGGTPERHQETRNPGRSRRRSRTSPPAARRVVFHEDTDRGHGSPSDLHAQLSPTPVQEAPHRAGAHPHHSHASRARATGSASHGPPAGSRQSVQLICHLPPRVGGRPTAGGSARHGHTAKGTRGRPKACTRSGGTTAPTSPLASGARCHRSRTRAAATRPTGLVHLGVPRPSCNTAKPPGRGGRTATTGTPRERRRSGRRDDRDLRPSGVR